MSAEYSAGFMMLSRLRCSQDYAEHLVRAFGAASAMEGVPGFFGTRLLRLIDTPSGDGLAEFITMSRWRDEAAYKAWLGSEGFDGSGQSAQASPIAVTVERYETLAE